MLGISLNIQEDVSTPHHQYHLPSLPNLAVFLFKLNFKSSIFIIKVRSPDLDGFALEEFNPVSVLLDLLSPYPAKKCGMCAIKTEDRAHGFDAFVAETQVRQHRGGTFYSSETESCREACGTSAVDERSWI